jgi:hypothetical protein
MPGVDEEIAAVRGIRARQIEHQVVGVRRHRFGSSDVFADDLILLQRGRARSAIGDHQIDAERYRRARMCQSFGDYLGAIVRQAVMHDDGLVIRQAPQTRFWVAAGWIDGDRTDLDRTEPEPGECADGCATFVEAGGKPNRGREMQAGDVNCKPVIASARCRPHRSRGPAETGACRDCKVMRGLRIEPERERADKCEIDRHVQISQIAPRVLHPLRPLSLSD